MSNKKHPVSRAQIRRRNKQLEELARIRGVERKLHFEEGGSLHEWRGGLHTIIANKKKSRDKQTSLPRQNKNGQIMSLTFSLTVIHY